EGLRHGGSFAEKSVAPPGLGMNRTSLYQGLAPLAMDRRPSGARDESDVLMDLYQGLAPLALDRRPSGAPDRPKAGIDRPSTSSRGCHPWLWTAAPPGLQELSPLAMDRRPSGAEETHSGQPLRAPGLGSTPATCGPRPARSRSSPPAGPTRCPRPHSAGP